MNNQKMAASIAEIKKLLQVSFIKEVQYLEWISNAIMEKKTNKD